MLSDSVTISTFRKPEDAIASLINKIHETSTNPILEIRFEDLEKYIKTYRDFIFYAKQNKDNIYIAQFDDLVKDPLAHFENIGKSFNILQLTEYELNFKKMSFSHSSWKDRYSGGLPREKYEDRLRIERELSNMDVIKKLNAEYEEFIYQYKTIV